MRNSKRREPPFLEPLLGRLGQKTPGAEARGGEGGHRQVAPGGYHLEVGLMGAETSQVDSVPLDKSGVFECPLLCQPFRA